MVLMMVDQWDTWAAPMADRWVLQRAAHWVDRWDKWVRHWADQWDTWAAPMADRWVLQRAAHLADRWVHHWAVRWVVQKGTLEHL